MSSWRPRYSYDDMSDAERLERIGQIRTREKERLAQFLTSLKAVLAVSERPQTLSAARSFIVENQEAGRITPFRLAGDLALLRLLARIGMAFDVPIVRRGAVRVRDDHDATLRAWGRECLRRSPDDACLLKYFDENLFRWARMRGRMADIEEIGQKRLAAWLRSEGHQSVRRADGIAFRGIVYVAPKPPVI